LPAIFLSVSGASGANSNIDFGTALWDLRGLDVLFQAIVILTIALGIAIVLFEKKRKGAQ